MKFNSVKDLQVVTHSPVPTPKAGDRSESRQTGWKVTDTNGGRNTERRGT